MTLEQLIIAPNSINGVTDGVNGRPLSAEGGDDGSKTPRLPRWTRQEILVLIQGKKVAENRVRRGGRTAGLGFGSSQVEPKWASVSSYCKRHGVNRGPVQCRKRWSNLAGDFKKIKEWENQIKEESDSFWAMRNDLRRERKLPGFFDKEVYDILDSGSDTASDPSLALALSSVPNPTPIAEEVKEEEAEPEPVFDSEKIAAPDDGLFSDDSEHDETGRSPDKEGPSSVNKTAIPAPMPISEKQYQPILRGCQGTTNEKPPANPEIDSTPQDGKKRKRVASDGDSSEETILQNQLIDILEKNGKMLTTQLEAQNMNFQLDREQRKDHAGSLINVLNKLADALGRIADKL